MTDPVLEPFLNAPLESAAEHDALRVLIDQVTPVIEGVIRGKVGATAEAIEREELFSEAVLQLIRRLQEIKPDPERQPIANFSGYAAVTAFNVVHAHFRRVQPERQRLVPAEAAPSERIDETASVESALVYRSALMLVWREIDLLPPKQRVALLLEIGRAHV